MLKKWRLFLLLFLLMPFKVLADGTDKFYIDATINTDGSMKVKEYILLSGNYNGLERYLYYKGTGNTDSSSYYNNSIYNGSSIEIDEIGEVTNDLPDSWDYSLISPSNSFSLVNYASKGDHGVYTKDVKDRGYYLKIFNPSYRNTAFYIEYTVKDVVVIHDDCAEILWNFLTDWSEFISDYRIIIHLPQESEDVRVFSHGPVNGANEITDKSTIKVWWDFLDEGADTDVRIVFDKALITDGTKKTNTNAFDNILSFEKEQAEKQNAIRENARKELERQEFIHKVLVIVFWVFNVILIALNTFLAIFYYKRYDKEYPNPLNVKYFRDFPNSYGPEIMGYLFTRSNIKPEYLSASILELVRKKSLKLEMGSNKNDFKLISITDY